MKIVVLDGYTLNPGDLTWDGLRQLGDVTVYDRTSFKKSEEDLIVQRAENAEILLINKTPISGESLKKMPNLKYIGVLATGYDVVDTAAAKKMGITVTNIPMYGTASVSQMAIALLLEMCHHVYAHNEDVKNGGWTESQDWCYWKYPIVELSEKTMGVIGYGKIGQSTGIIAQSMGMKILAYDINKNESLESSTMRYVELEELLKDSDVITLHCPLIESNRGIINKNSISKMKDGVMIINNARGPLIVEEDLAEALNNGKVAGAALDVVSTEPIKEDNPLLKAKNCIITPHISWASKESRQRLMNIAVDNVKQFINGNPVNVINK